jgi:hypothetical protein
LSKHNTNDEALKALVERVFNIERDFADTKAEYTDSKKDMKAEIKSREEELGTTPAEVFAMAKIRMDEHAAQEELDAATSTNLLYGRLFGFTKSEDAPAEEEDDALD